MKDSQARVLSSPIGGAATLHLVQTGHSGSNPLPVWLAHLPNPTDAATLRTMSELPARVLWCLDPRDILVELARDDLGGLILDLSDGVAVEADLIVTAMAQRAAAVRSLLRFDLTGAATNLFLRLNARLPSSICSLRRFDDLDTSIRELDTASQPSASRRVIIRHILPFVPPRARRIVVGAVIVGQRTASVEELALLCGSSRRSLELEVQRAGLVPVKRLLMCMLAIHAAWDVHQPGWSVKRAAALSGAPSARALSARIERVTGVRFGDWVHRYSVAERLDCITTLICPGAA